MRPSDFQVSMRIAALCAGIIALPALLAAQRAIVGPDTGKPGQTLSYQLLDQGKPVSGVIWKQGFNPDRYAGNDYATSFRMKVTPQPDGSVQLIAPSPGRYRLVAGSAGSSFRKAILIRPQQPPLAVRGLTLMLTADTVNGPGPVRQRASDRLAVAKRMGVEWIAPFDQACIDMDRIDSTDGSFEFTWDQTLCPNLPQEDLEWIIDEAHRQGFKVGLRGGLGAVKGGFSGYEFVDLQWNLSGLSEAQILTVQAAVSRHLVKLAAIAQKHSVEALFAGENWDTTMATSTPSSQLLASLGAGWLSLIDQLRAAYSGEIWFGWPTPCGRWGYPGEFDAWGKVDAVHLFGMLKGTGAICTESPPVTGYNNAIAEDMLIGLSDLSDPVGYPPFQFGKNTGRPTMWTDFYVMPVDSIGWDPFPVWGDAHPLDSQELIDTFEAMVSRIKSGMPKGLFLGYMDLWNMDRTALLSNPSVVHAITNWYSGDPSYFETCFAPQDPDVVFQPNFNCPLGPYSIYLRSPATFVADSGDPSIQVLLITLDGAARLAMLPQDFSAVHKIKRSSSAAYLTISFRSGADGEYDLQVNSETTLKLTRNPNGSAAKVLGTYVESKPGSATNWRSIGISAVGAHISVSLDGKTVIDVVDGDGALLGTGGRFSGGNGDSEVSEIVVRQPPLVPATPDSPLVQAVVNAASYLGVTIGPGEIVTLFGAQMGPAKLAYFAPDQNGKIGTTLAGTRVLFDGVAAPLIYTQAGQVTAIVPFGVGANSTKVQVEYQGKTSPALNVPVTDTTPGIFTANSGGDGQAAAINQDGTFNSASNAASRGTVLTLFLTGHGQVNPSGVDGAIVTGTPPKLVAGVEVWIGHVSAQIQYAGVAPQSTNGLMQLNVVVPAGAPTGPDIPILVGMGHYVTQPGVTVAIK